MARGEVDPQRVVALVGELTRLHLANGLEGGVAWRVENNETRQTRFAIAIVVDHDGAVEERVATTAMCASFMKSLPCSARWGQ